MAKEKVSSPPASVLIIRLSAIGDVVMASAFVSALRRSWPQTHITWLVEPAAAGMLAHNTQLDRVLIWPKHEWQALWRQRRFVSLAREIYRFRKALRRQKYDIAIDLQGLFKSGIWAYLSRAKRRIGLDSRELSKIFMTEVVRRGGDRLRMGSEYLYLSRYMEFDSDEFHAHIGLSVHDIKLSLTFAQHHAATGYMVICPFTTRPQKHWFTAHWIALAHSLHKEFATPIVMLGGANDQESAQAICTQAENIIIDMTGQTSLTEAAALIAQARLLIGVDTGLVHIGPAFATPTIALFGSTCPYRDTGRDNTVVLYHALVCSPCKRKPTCDGKFSCMRGIRPAEVLDHARRLLPYDTAHN